jgi:hypothetical protein
MNIRVMAEDWIPPAICLALFVTTVLWGRWAKAQSDLAVSRLKQATAAYDYAERERHESYRVLALAIQADPELVERLHAKYGDAAVEEPEGQRDE